MQGTRIRLLVGGALLACTAVNVQAEALQPDPAWQQGSLDNGFSWQLLTTPQRPSDRTELRLVVRTGSLAETAQQQGFAHFLPRIALIRSQCFTTAQLHSFWQQSMDSHRPLTPVVSSYDYTSYNLSLPNNRPDLLKEALAWLVNAAGKMNIDSANVQAALQAPQDPIDAMPSDTTDAWWRYRITGSTLAGHDPSLVPANPIQADLLSKFYHQWYTPDAMTLYVVGNVDGRSMAEQINRTFSVLKGRREVPQTMPTLVDMQPKAMTVMDASVTQDRLSLIWSMPWKPIQESAALNDYWRSDLAREALFWHLQQSMKSTVANAPETKSDALAVPNLSFDCGVQYQIAQCAIRLDNPQEKVQESLKQLATELLKVRDKGIPQAEFDALIAQKQDQLNKLFATYARTDTGVLMAQRLRSQQNSVVDIAPEQYQKLRQKFLSSLTLDMLNQELKQQLSREPSMLLTQPKGEPEMDVQGLQGIYDAIMAPAVEAAPQVSAPAAAPTESASTAQ